MYDVLCYLSDMEAEGLIYSDCYDLTNKTNFRSTLWTWGGGQGFLYPVSALCGCASGN